MVIIGNPRRKRSRRKMTAKQRKYFGRRTSRRRKSYARNPVVHRRRRRTARRSTRSRRYYARNPISRRRYSRARSGGFFRRSASRAGGFLEKYGFDTVLPATVGAAGALALDMAWGYLPIPASLQTGPLAPVVRLAGAFGIGLTAGMIGGRKFGRDVTAGATVVTLYDLLKGWLKTQYPALPLQGLGRGRTWYNPGLNIGPARARLGVYLQGMGEYTPDYVSEVNQDTDQFQDVPDQLGLYI